MAVIRTCAACGTKNRVPARHLADAGKCGACRQPLPAIDKPLAADLALFDEVVKEARVPVLVDFWAAWCGPCRMAAPEVERTAVEIAGRAVVLKVDTEAVPQLSARYNVRSIPLFLVFRGGRVVQQQAGAVGHAQLVGWLRAAEQLAAV